MYIYESIFTLVCKLLCAFVECRVVELNFNLVFGVYEHVKLNFRLNPIDAFVRSFFVDNKQFLPVERYFYAGFLFCWFDRSQNTTKCCVNSVFSKTTIATISGLRVWY